ncbi:hypothetical protein AB6Q56_11190 [Dechloromonas sp. ARDL1]|uniref:hypothetical protein n=1 Tax=Dechloromonas sp. ARDL1 TaxID=3322121 RepID=UPI003DA739BD
MTKKNQLNIAIAATFGYLIGIELIGPYLPNWLAIPLSLIGGGALLPYNPQSVVCWGIGRIATEIDACFDRISPALGGRWRG